MYVCITHMRYGFCVHMHVCSRGTAWMDTYLCSVHYSEGPVGILFGKL